MPEPPNQKFDANAKRRFLDHYAETGLLTKSAEAAGVTYRTMQRHRTEDPEFAQQVEDAKMQFRDLISEEVFRRGVKGYDRPIYQRGEYVGIERMYSDRMLELTAKRYEPEFRDKQQLDVNHSGGVLVVQSKTESTEEWLKQWGNLPADTGSIGDEPSPKKTKRG